MRTYFLISGLIGVLSCAANARADLVETLSRNELTTSLRGAICETLLHKAHADATRADLNLFSAHRADRLRIGEDTPGHANHLVVNELSAGILHRALADHLGAAERWVEHLADDPTAHVTTLTFTGNRAIEDYLELSAATERTLNEIEIPQPLRDRVRFKMRAINLTVTAGLVATLATGLAGHWGEGGALLAVPVVAALSYVGYVAHRFRFDRDEARTTFDLRVRDYLAAGPEHQSIMWDFSTTTYRVLNPLLDALWTGDAVKIGEQLGRFQAFSVIPAGPNVVFWPYDRIRHGAEVANERRRTLGDGYVTVDRLIDYDAKQKAPRLTITLRTSSRNPAAVR